MNEKEFKEVCVLVSLGDIILITRVDQGFYVVESEEAITKLPMEDFHRYYELDTSGKSIVKIKDIWVDLYNKTSNTDENKKYKQYLELKKEFESGPSEKPKGLEELVTQLKKLGVITQIHP